MGMGIMRSMGGMRGRGWTEADIDAEERALAYRSLGSGTAGCAGFLIRNVGELQLHELIR
jgi:hypothetical protein